MQKFKIGDKVTSPRDNPYVGIIKDSAQNPGDERYYWVLFPNRSNWIRCEESRLKPAIPPANPNMYKFKVTTGGDIDFQRICNEAPKDVNIIRVEMPGSYSLGWILVRGSAVGKQFPIECTVTTPDCRYTSKNLQGWYSFPLYSIKEVQPILDGVREKIKIYAAEKAAEKAKFSVTVRYEK